LKQCHKTSFLKIFTYNNFKPSKIKFLKKHGLKMHKSKLNNDYQLDLKSILKKIKKLGVNLI